MADFKTQWLHALAGMARAMLALEGHVATPSALKTLQGEPSSDDCGTDGAEVDDADSSARWSSNRLLAFR